jgi:hypothetical protein
VNVIVRNSVIRGSMRVRRIFHSEWSPWSASRWRTLEAAAQLHLLTTRFELPLINRRTSTLDRRWTVSSRPACPGCCCSGPGHQQAHRYHWRTFMLDDPIVDPTDEVCVCHTAFTYVSPSEQRRYVFVKSSACRDGLRQGQICGAPWTDRVGLRVWRGASDPPAVDTSRFPLSTDLRSPAELATLIGEFRHVAGRGVRGRWCDRVGRGFASALSRRRCRAAGRHGSPWRPWRFLTSSPPACDCG